MDPIEKQLTHAIELYVALQNWSRKLEGIRDPTKVFPVILALDRGLKSIKKIEQEHPLQELAREVRASFDTREFRAILLAAFNWRRDAQRSKDAARTKLRVAKVKQIAGIPQRRQICRNRKMFPPQPSAEQLVRQAANAEKFKRDFIAFLNSVPEAAMRRMHAAEEYVDIYRAGRRLYGSYGKRQ